MKIEQYKKIGMSLALTTVLSLTTTGCGEWTLTKASTNDNTSTKDNTSNTSTNDNTLNTSTDLNASNASTRVDITVELAKVHDANVTDSSTPTQVATHKSTNVYTFANTPTYPVVVNGGWMDVNDNGKKDAKDVNLDIEMKSYGTTVTPITTFVADTNKTKREQKLNELVKRLNESGIGANTTITAKDLLKVPSVAPRDVFIIANAIYKEMKEHADTLPDEDSIITQFNSIDTLDKNATAKDFQENIIDNLVSQNLLDYSKPVIITPTISNTVNVTNDTTEVTLPNLDAYSSIIIYKKIDKTIADGLLNIYKSNTGFKSSNISASCSDFGFTDTDIETNTAMGGMVIKTYSITRTSPFSIKTCTESDYGEAQYSSGNANILSYYGMNNITSDNIPTTSDTTKVTSPDLGDYNQAIIFKNISQTFADSMIDAYASLPDNKFIRKYANCTDLGFTDDEIRYNETNSLGVVTKTYLNYSTNKTCTENDYSNSSYESGDANSIIYSTSNN